MALTSSCSETGAFGLDSVSRSSSTLVSRRFRHLYGHPFHPSLSLTPPRRALTPAAWYMQGDYLYPVLLVAFNESILTATRVSSLYSFCSVITGTLLGLVIIKVRRLKPFIMFGCCLFAVAFGLLIRYRGGTDGENEAGVIGAQVVLGIGEWHDVALEEGLTDSRRDVLVSYASVGASPNETRA